MGKEFAGTAVGCKGGKWCFGGTMFAPGTMSGTLRNCEMGAGSAGANAVSGSECSGTIENCSITGLLFPLKCKGAFIRNSRITVTYANVDCILLNSNVF